LERLLAALKELSSPLAAVASDPLLGVESSYEGGTLCHSVRGRC
jgi:hypothetical protein